MFKRRIPAVIETERLTAWLDPDHNHYLGFGGAGDALLLLATCYKDPLAKVTFFANETTFAPQFFDLFGVPAFIHRNIARCPETIALQQQIQALPTFKGSAHLPDGLDYEDWRRNPNKYKDRIVTTTTWAEDLGREDVQSLVVIGPAGSERNPKHRRWLTHLEYNRLIQHYRKRDYGIIVVGSEANLAEYGHYPDALVWWMTADMLVDNAGDYEPIDLRQCLRWINSASEVVSVDTWLKTYSLLAGIKTKVIPARDERGATKTYGSVASDYVFLNPSIWPAIGFKNHLHTN